jgi:hypothetical protein
MSGPEVRTQKLSGFGFGFGWETQNPNPNPKIQKIQKSKPKSKPINPKNPKSKPKSKPKNPKPKLNPNPKPIFFIWEFYNNFLIFKQFMLGSLIFITNKAQVSMVKYFIYLLGFSYLLGFTT